MDRRGHISNDSAEKIFLTRQSVVTLGRRVFLRNDVTKCVNVTDNIQRRLCKQQSTTLPSRPSPVPALLAVAPFSLRPSYMPIP